MLVNTFKSDTKTEVVTNYLRKLQKINKKSVKSAEIIKMQGMKYNEFTKEYIWEENEDTNQELNIKHDIKR